MKTPVRLSALALLMITTVAVKAEEQCEAPTGQWQSREAVRHFAEERGWIVRRIKIDDGCYEIHALDQSGKRFEARIDPVTLTVLEIETHGDRGEHGENEHEAEKP